MCRRLLDTERSECTLRIFAETSVHTLRCMPCTALVWPVPLVAPFGGPLEGADFEAGGPRGSDGEVVLSRAQA